MGTIGAAEHKTVTHQNPCLYDVDDIPEDEVVCLGGNLPLSWTDQPKVNSLLHDFKGRRAGIHNNRQEWKI